MVVNLLGGLIWWLVLCASGVLYMVAFLGLGGDVYTVWCNRCMVLVYWAECFVWILRGSYLLCSFTSRLLGMAHWLVLHFAHRLRLDIWISPHQILCTVRMCSVLPICRNQSFQKICSEQLVATKSNTLNYVQRGISAPSLHRLAFSHWRTIWDLSGQDMFEMPVLYSGNAKLVDGKNHLFLSIFSRRWNVILYQWGSVLVPSQHRERATPTWSLEKKLTRLEEPKIENHTSSLTVLTW